MGSELVSLKVDVPADLRRRLKTIAVRSDMTLRSVVQQVLTEVVEVMEHAANKAESSASLKD
jgi:hypothetical protein